MRSFGALCRRAAACLALAALLTCGRIEPAAALSCSASVSDINFGTVDLLQGSAVDTTATVSISCNGITLAGVRVCPYIGNGSGGRDSSYRHLQGAGSAVAYQLYTDAARTIVWGDATLGFGSYPTVDFAGNAGGTGTGSTTLTLYGRIPAGHAPVAADDYSSNFTVADTDFEYGTNDLSLPACSAAQILSGSVNPTFAASAAIEKDCVVSAGNVSFGTHGLLSSSLTSSGVVTVKCTPATDYSVALSNGNNGASPGERKMKNGSETVTYGLYRDTGRTNLWGDTAGFLASATGSGANQNFTVYGLVPAQPTPSPGNYTDTVVVTVTY
ncbi:MAG: spore coat U domain-containing protein [Bauldia sp.]